jgi:hypothetical protein
MARRTVMKESEKWRSGRDSVRTSWTSPSTREGKNAMAFGHHESEAAEGDGHVVVPAREAAALVVVDAEFALEVLVHGAPALHRDANELGERGVFATFHRAPASGTRSSLTSR